MLVHTLVLRLLLGNVESDAKWGEALDLDQVLRFAISLVGDQLFDVFDDLHVDQILLSRIEAFDDRRAAAFVRVIDLGGDDDFGVEVDHMLRFLIQVRRLL